MNKEEVLIHLREAKLAHKEWVQKAKLLIEGFKMDKNAIPVNATSCAFGKWFYSDAQKLNGLRNNGLECMDNIELYHTKLHDAYLKIFKLYYLVENKGFFSKLFTGKKKITEETIALGREYFEELDYISKDLLSEISRLERRVIAIGDDELGKL